MMKADYRRIMLAWVALLGAMLCACKSVPPDASAPYRAAAAQESRTSLNAVVAGAPDASAAMQRLISDKKIVFLSEQHDIVNPILFITKNLRAFYAAGLRYLFLEGGSMQLPDSPNYSFFVFYPWTRAGWKYEEVGFAQALHDINSSLAEKDRIKVIFAEAGNVEPGSYDPQKVPELLNGRDRYASNRIIATMEAALPGDKGLVFYGADHGSTRTWRAYGEGAGVPIFDWKPIGTYLHEKYGTRFASVEFEYLPRFKDRFAPAEWASLATTQAYVETDAFGGIMPRNGMDQYDATIFERDPIYGIGYQFAPTDQNLRAMFRDLRQLELSPQQLIEDSGTFRFDPRGRFLAYIYYFKLYFGDHFDYSLWNPRASLASALDGLEAYAFAPGLSPSAKMAAQMPEESALREYAKLMVSSGIDVYASSNRESNFNLPDLIGPMQSASEIFPQDLWPQYWLAVAFTRNGNDQAALAEWERFFARPLSSSMEVLPRALEMAADCAKHLGLNDRAQGYRTQASTSANEHRLDLSRYADL